MQISQNAALFSILGVTYGGDGTTTFALPNLPCVPLGAGQGPGLSGYALGQTGGQATAILIEPEMPQHNHSFNLSTDWASQGSPEGHQLASAAASWSQSMWDMTEGDGAERGEIHAYFYSTNPASARAELAPGAIATNGSGAAHNNMQPYLALNFCIALRGVTPMRDGDPPPPREPFLGEIAICAFGFAPRGWMPCAGQTLPIASHSRLFSLLGTTYGGDGRETFALPDLRGRVPLGAGGSFPLGQQAGEEFHALSSAELPAHRHKLMADAVSKTGKDPSPGAVLGCSAGMLLAGTTTFFLTGIAQDYSFYNQPFVANLYSNATPGTTLHPSTIGNTGGGTPHENRMPSLALGFCINVNPKAPFPTPT